jgi:molybdopterin synthase sulfur carrier subunit
MRIILRYFADYREITGLKEMLIDVRENQTIGGLLRIMVNKYPALKPEIFEDQEELKESVTILVNGRSIEFLERMKTRLQEGDMVTLFPPVAGG